ncbi:MAG: metabolite traffic protein EboE [Phycisphaerales bacterium]
MTRPEASGAANASPNASPDIITNADARAATAAGLRIGYCTNVHAGTALSGVRENLRVHARAVRERLINVGTDARWTQPMGIGLWLAADAARELRAEDGVAALRDDLAELGLQAFTFNGFPAGNFHRRSVKHAVYRPSWDDPRRLAFTRDLAEIIAALHDAGDEASISTLPIGWRAWTDDDAMQRAVLHLRLTAMHLAELERRTGVFVHVDLEPEPGCVLDRPGDVVRFFEQWLLAGASATEERVVRRHLRVCHDVCHAAVMFDGQAESMRVFDAAGIHVGKIQVSAALDIDFRRMPEAVRAAALERLDAFAEPRFLHQTAIRRRSDGPVELLDDLPMAITRARRPATSDSAAGDPVDEHWRVHFHVPIHADDLTPLASTAPMIDEAVSAAFDRGVRHFEIETYAWNVLPEAMQPDALAEGIADELQWFLKRPSVRAMMDGTAAEAADPPLVEVVPGAVPDRSPEAASAEPDPSGGSSR